MQIANFFWIVMLVMGGFFIFFIVSVGYMLLKERRSNKRAAAFTPAFQAPELVPAVKEFVVSQEQPAQYYTGNPQPYPGSPQPYPVQYSAVYQTGYPASYQSQERSFRTHENYATQPTAQRNTNPGGYQQGRVTNDNQPRFVIVNSSAEIRFR